VPKVVIATWLIAFGVVVQARAQEMEPRAYSPSPLGTNFFAAVLGGSRGEILFDAAVPITDAHAELGTATLGYGRTFRLGSRQGLVALALPYAWGHAEGNVGGTSRRVWRSGFADVRIKVSLNLVGPRAMTVDEFRKSPRKTIFGVSLAVQAPTGEYERTQLINIGTNRWAVKPEVGVSIPAGGWYLDLYAGVWFFEDNDAFYAGASKKQQDPLTALQFHSSYTFKNRAWIAFDATWYGGGASTVDANPPSQPQSNSRAGLTFSAPITAHQSIKVSGSTGTTTRTGTDFDSLLVGWQFTWFDHTSAARQGG
jgi:hypothetical protein